MSNFDTTMTYTENVRQIKRSKNILRNLLNTHKTEIAKMQPIVKKCVDDNIIIKENDILELEWDIVYPDENDGTNCNLLFKYTLNGEEFSNFNFDVPEDELYSDIKD